MTVQEKETKEWPNPVLTAPLSLDRDSDGNYKAPNLLQRILSLLGSARPGSDLTHLQASQLITDNEFPSFYS